MQGWPGAPLYKVGWPCWPVALDGVTVAAVDRQNLGWADYASVGDQIVNCIEV